MHTGQFYKRTKKTSPPNRIIIPSKESDEDMVGSSNSEMDISIESDSARVQGWGQVQLTKYSSTPSTPNIYQVQVLVKYSFF